MQIQKHVPNTITLLNLLCGCIALVFVSKADFMSGFAFVCLGIFLDFFDGFFARLFKVSSPLGLQLDSLADMVTSGVVPGYVMYLMLDRLTDNPYLPFVGFAITLGACYRLANFNIDTRQSDSFIGLPTPANALFFLSLPLVPEFELLQSIPFLVVLSLLSAFVMNAEIPLFSLKIKKFNFKDNLLQIVFLTLSLLLLVVFRFLGISLIIVMYVLLSVINNTVLKSKS
ncbi:phosphatidylserine synthase [Flavobacterium sp. CYK-4]|uniref:CDP-alcohol phosphatidyltransferase family protein n=1 Tax=Flavobacterium lotistagni TaxID=2709660 RepID=UPI00140E6CE7|nr:CDP-alcohol phosphatidyltransferase family protein [Flavobacterium lotistagni]NHM06393.1 phosphatidylserine synthase [Flavobacterium lotistagni]